MRRARRGPLCFIKDTQLPFITHEPRPPSMSSHTRTCDSRARTCDSRASLIRCKEPERPAGGLGFTPPDGLRFAPPWTRAATEKRCKFRRRGHARRLICVVGSHYTVRACDGVRPPALVARATAPVSACTWLTYRILRGAQRPCPHAGPCGAAEVAAGPAPGRCVLDSRAGHEAQWASLGRTRLASFTAGLP